MKFDEIIHACRIMNKRKSKFLPEIHGYRRVSECHWNDTYQCPYNPEHIVQYSRCQHHIVKCAEKYSYLGMLTCPFNATHVTTKDEHQYHLRHCPDRIMIDYGGNEEDALLLKNRQHGNTDVPDYHTYAEDFHWDNVSDEEDEDDSEAGPSGSDPSGSDLAGSDPSGHNDDDLEEEYSSGSYEESGNTADLMSYRKPRHDPLILKMNAIEQGGSNPVPALPPQVEAEVIETNIGGIRKPRTAPMLLNSLPKDEHCDVSSEDFSVESFVTCNPESACGEGLTSRDSGRGCSISYSDSISSMGRGVKADRSSLDCLQFEPVPGKSVSNRDQRSLPAGVTLLGLGRGKYVRLYARGMAMS